MRYGMYRGIALSVLCLCLTTLSGCFWKVQTVKIINETDYPLTSVRLIPYYEDAETQNAVADLAKNLLPKDADGYTISLAPGSTTVGRLVRRPTCYIKAVTLYVNNAYQKYVDNKPLDLSSVPANTLLIMRVQGGEGGQSCPKVEVACE